MLTEKRTSTSIPINVNCHNKNQSVVREQITHFIKPKQIYYKCVFIDLKIIWGIYVPVYSQISIKLFWIGKREIIHKELNSAEVDRVIEMAWEDRTPFDAIDYQFNLKEKEVIQLMRSNLKSSSFKMWRERVAGRKSKHGFPNQKTKFRSAKQKWKSNCKKIFNLP